MTPCALTHGKRSQDRRSQAASSPRWRVRENCLDAGACNYETLENTTAVAASNIAVIVDPERYSISAEVVNVPPL
jgi:hypothetical protein